MYKITLTVFSILLFAFNGYCADNKSKSDVENKKAETEAKAPDMSFNDDYFVGLKAFDDGLYDVAESCLANYLSHENKSQKAGFATYLLYQVYMSQGNYKSAQYTFTQLANFKDSRFNRQKMLKDQMFIETKLSCDGAKNLLLTSPKNEYLEVYAKSACVVDKDITNLLSKIDVSSETLYTVLERVQKDKELVFSTYDNLRAEKRTPKLMNFYGKYFYSNNMKSEFYALYKVYQDSELASFVLDDTWKSGDYKKYIESFKKEVKNDYKLDKIVYCRMIEASNKEMVNFDCDLVDKCLGTKSPDFNKTKLACYMRKEDKEKISWFIGTLTVQDTLKLCEYGKYIIGKKLYDIKFLNKFEKCPDKASMYESLLKFKDYNGIIRLGGSGSSQLDIAYMAIAYYNLGNNTQYNNYLNKLTDVDLSGMVKRAVSRGSL